MFFGSKRKLHKHNAIQVYCVGNKLTSYTYDVNYLGAKLDQSVSEDGMPENGISKWKAQVTFLSRQVQKVDLKTK